MGSNLVINKEIEKYIEDNSLELNPIQKEIILHNQNLGNIKRMQIAVSQCHFLHLIIKISNIKKILEIGTFTGLSTLSMSLAIPDDGKLIALDKNEKTSEIAINFFYRRNIFKINVIFGKSPFIFLKKLFGDFHLFVVVQI